MLTTVSAFSAATGGVGAEAASAFFSIVSERTVIQLDILNYYWLYNVVM
jgi:hypothetical protein